MLYQLSYGHHRDNSGQSYSDWVGGRQVISAARRAYSLRKHWRAACKIGVSAPPSANSRAKKLDPSSQSAHDSVRGLFLTFAPPGEKLFDDSGATTNPARECLDRAALIYAFVAYSAWGFFPLYWKLLHHLSATEILAHRLIWSCFFYWLILAIWGKGARSFSDLWQVFKTEAKWIVLACVFISINWLTYIYAVNTERVMQGSLAYFITPLMNVFFGALIFKEKLRSKTKWALAWVCVGLCSFIFLAHQVPGLALIMALTFSSYGLCKKKLKASPMLTSFLESLVALPVALVAALMIRQQTSDSLALSEFLLLMGGGLVTALPLLWFSMAAQKIPLSTMGFMQFISPSIQFLLAVFLYREEVGLPQIIAFGAIWIGVGLYLNDVVSGQK